MSKVMEDMQEITPLLEVKDLHVEFSSDLGLVSAVNGVDLTMSAGESIVILGESGCGKSVTAQAIMGVVPQPPGNVRAQKLHLKGQDLMAMSPSQHRKIRGRDMALIFQDALTSLNPRFTIGNQIVEMICYHVRLSKREAWERAEELLARVGIPSPAERLKAYPHQLSGGMRQRALIAMSVALGPQLLIADEPTTALDVTVQAQVLDLIKSLQADSGMGLILITHDLAVAKKVADRILVMYAGRVVEQATVEELFANPSHPYTRGLMRSTPSAALLGKALTPIKGSPPDLRALPSGCPFRPRCEEATGRLCSGPATKHIRQRRAYEPVPLFTREHGRAGMTVQNEKASSPAGPILKIRDLACHFTSRKGPFYARQEQVVRALDGVSFDLHPGQTLGIVGESGSGKSTLARCLMRLEDPTEGQILFGDLDLATASADMLRPVRRDIQMVFQDPWASLNARHTIGEIITEPWEIHKGVVPPSEHKAKVAELLTLVGLDPNFAHRYPNQLSGGQRQRISIARALALSPKIIILDEAVSALDVSVQAQILNLLSDLQARLGISYLFISHDLSVVRHLCHQIGVMYLGRLVEMGETEEIFENPAHPYSQALLSAMPEASEEDRILLEGEVPSPLNPPSGCGFRTRCWKAEAICAQDRPHLEAVADTEGAHLSACPFSGVEGST